MPCLVLMLAATFGSLSRGGSLMALGLMAGCLGVLLVSTVGRGWRFALPLGLAPLGLALGLWLVWEPLSNRFLREFTEMRTYAAMGAHVTARARHCPHVPARARHCPHLTARARRQPRWGRRLFCVFWIKTHRS